jgi:hypothetical protein
VMLLTRECRLDDERDGIGMQRIAHHSLIRIATRNVYDSYSFRNEVQRSSHTRLMNK